MLKTIIRDRLAGHRIKDVAAACKMTRAAICQWLSGVRIPEATNYRAFLAHTGDPDEQAAWDAWTKAWQVEAERRLCSTNPSASQPNQAAA